MAITDEMKILGVELLIAHALEGLMMTHDLDYELWRRIEDRREAALNPDLTPQEQKLLSLALSLARLSAQRDSLAGLWS